MLSSSDIVQPRASIDADGTVEGYASLFGAIDQANDMVMPGAFAASLRQRDIRRVPMLFQHDPAEPVGIWDELKEDWLGLRVRGRLIPDVLRGRELLALLRAGSRPFPSRGAGDDGNGQPVPMCRAPDGTDQLQCYCSEGLCGAGMLDAAAAVSAALGTLARIDVEPAMPQVGDTLRFSAASSLVRAGRSIVAYEWWLDSTPVAAGFSGAADAAEVAIAAAAAGTLTLRLVLTDELGQRSETQRSVTVAAAAEPVLPVALAPAAGGGGGGGASSAIWVALLALAVAALLATRRRA
jgi:hypothetical protein